MDLIGAINPTFSVRRQALGIYAVSTYSTPSLCKTNSQGKQVPMPLGVPLGRDHSIGYRFSTSSRMAGKKFGTYTLSTDNYVTRLPSGLPVNTLVAIVQEKTTRKSKYRYCIFTLPLDPPATGNCLQIRTFQIRDKILLRNFETTIKLRVYLLQKYQLE